MDIDNKNIDYSCLCFILSHNIVIIIKYRDIIHEIIPKSRGNKQKPWINQKEEEVQQEESNYYSKNIM